MLKVKNLPVLIVPSHVLIIPSPALIVLLHVNRFPNKLASYVPNNILRNPFFIYFASFLIVSLMPFIMKPDSLRDFIVFMKSLMSLLKINDGLLPDPDIV